MILALPAVPDPRRRQPLAVVIVLRGAAGMGRNRGGGAIEEIQIASTAR
jgi:hypothetical protein